MARTTLGFMKMKMSCLFVTFTGKRAEGSGTWEEEENEEDSCSGKGEYVEH